jgi:putative ABC transport system permease protein
LDLQIGATIRIRASSGDVLQGRVRGVVRPDGEVAEDMQVFGYAFVDLAQAQTLLAHKSAQVDHIYLRLPASASTESVVGLLNQSFPHAQIRTDADVWQERQSSLKTWTRALSAIGMLAILIGSLGIIDTTIVSVRRKSAEIAIIKALGATTNQVRNVVLAEAALIGGIGSLLGVMVGLGGGLVLANLLSQVLSLPIRLQLCPEPLALGLVLGLGLSLTFAYLPAQYAAQLPPNLILRQANRGSGSQLKPWSLRQLLVVAGGAGVVISVLMRSNLGFVLAYGAMLGMAGLGWFISKMVLLIRQPPRAWGGYPLRIALQHLKSQAQRVTLVLVALIVAVSALGVVLFLGSNIKQAFRRSIHRDLDFAFMVIAPSERRDEIILQLEARPGVETVVPVRRERIIPLRINGRDITKQLDVALSNPDYASLLTDMAIQGIPLESGWGERNIVAGRGLTKAADEGRHTLIMLQPVANALQIEVGDEVTLDINGKIETYQVVGLEEKPLFVTGLFATSVTNLEQQGSGVSAVFYVQTSLSDAARIAGQMRRELPDVIVLEASEMLSGVNQLINQQMWFLSVVAALVMLVGLLIIANGVALTMFEERRVWAVMKSVGARRAHLLEVILWEYGFVSLAGALAGLFLAVGASVLIMRVVFKMSADFAPLEAALLVLLTVIVALGAAWLAAWHAIEEPPLPVLRNE